MSRLLRDLNVARSSLAEQNDKLEKSLALSDRFKISKRRTSEEISSILDGALGRAETIRAIEQLQAKLRELDLEKELKLEIELVLGAATEQIRRAR